MFIAAPFAINKTQKQPRCPSTEEQIKMWYIYAMDYYSAIKRNKIVTCSDWMDLETVIQSNVRQREENKYILTHICEIQKNGTENFCKAEIETQMQRTNIQTSKGKGKENELGDLDRHIYPAKYKIDNSRKPTVQHRELYSVLYGDLTKLLNHAQLFETP